MSTKSQEKEKMQFQREKRAKRLFEREKKKVGHNDHKPQYLRHLDLKRALRRSQGGIIL